jgi:hypothetical protein
MVHFRVARLDAMVAQSRQAGVPVEIDAQSHPNGRFARLYHPEGTPIARWEPALQEMLQLLVAGFSGGRSLAGMPWRSLPHY